MKSTHFIIIYLLLSTVIHYASFAQDNTQVGLPDGAIARLGKGGINIMQFSPDGNKLAVGTDVGVWLYDVSDGNATALYTDKPSQVNALAFSDDGKILASGGYGNNNIQLWNLEDNTQYSNFILTSFVKALVFQGQTLISYDRRGNVSYWDKDTGIILTELMKIPAKIAIFSQTGKILACADSLGKIYIYDTVTKENYSVLVDTELKKELQCISISPIDKIIASGSKDNIIRFLKYNDDYKVTSLLGKTAGIRSTAFSTDGKFLACGDLNKEITLWDFVNLKRIRVLKGHKSTVNALAFSPDGADKYSGCLASGSLDGTIRFWNPDTGEELVTFATGHTKWIKAIAFAENMSSIVSANFTGSVDVWDLNSNRTISTFIDGECDFARVQTFSSDAMRYLCLGNDGYTVTFDSYGFGYSIHSGNNKNIKTLQLWEINTGKELKGPWNDTTSDVIALSPDYSIIALYDKDNLIGWSLDTSDELFNINSEESAFIDSMIFTSNSKLLALHESSEKPKIFNIQTPNEPPIQIKHDASSLAFSPDVKTLATTDKRRIYLYKLAQLPNTLPKTFPIDLNISKGLMLFSPDSKIIVGAGTINIRSNVVIKLWDVETGVEIRTLTGHTEPIESLAFSHDGKILASGSFDGTILLWDWEKISNRQDNTQ